LLKIRGYRPRLIYIKYKKKKRRFSAQWQHSYFNSFYSSDTGYVVYGTITTFTGLTKHLTNSVTLNCSTEFISDKRVIASTSNSWNVSSIYGASRDSESWDNFNSSQIYPYPCIKDSE
jgi:hypothetical protein